MLTSIYMDVNILPVLVASEGSSDRFVNSCLGLEREGLERAGVMILPGWRALGCTIGGGNNIQMAEATPNLDPIAGEQQ